MSSSFSSNSQEKIQYLPSLVVDGIKGRGNQFISIKELYPWLAIDWETEREVNGVVVYLRKDSLDEFREIDVRVGHEIVGTTVNQPLLTNSRCAYYKGNVSEAKEDASGALFLPLICTEELKGRFISLQRLQFGVLAIDEIELDPRPVNGGWSENATFGECSESCGNGTTTAKRSCTNPEPTNGGYPCFGDPEVTKACNTHECPGNTTHR